MKTTIVLIALLALAGSAAADAEAHLTANLNGESHTVDVYVTDDGSATVLVDGEPVTAPDAPTLP